MLKGYRGILIAVGGLSLASPSHSQHGNPDQPEAKGESEAQLERIASAIEKQPIATTPDGGCDPGQDDRQSDLCAQWKAADSAAESARWTFWNLILMLGGLALGGGTLFAAWRAAHWAKRAAEETGRGANAAETALAEARNVTSLQLRPYVALTEAPDDDHQPFSRQTVLKMLVKNFGQTPATSVRFSVGAVAAERPIADYIVPLQKSGSYGTIAPGDLRTERLYARDLKPADFGDVASGEMHMLVRMRLDYSWPGGTDFHDVTMILSDPATNEWNLLTDERRQTANSDTSQHPKG